MSQPSRPIYRNLALWALIVVIGLMLFQLLNTTRDAHNVVPYTDFIQAVEQGRVTQVTIQGDNILGLYTDRSPFGTTAPDDPDLVRMLRESGVSIVVEPVAEDSLFKTILISWVPMLLLIGVWIFFMRQMQGGGKTMSFGKSRAKLLTEEETRVSFADVAGAEEAKEEVSEIVEFLKSPKKFTRLGGRIPKGVLLVGPPGTGKTLLARAIAGEADVPFFSISGSDFVEMFVGVGASRVRDLFTQGKKHAPCIIFIDEIDAVGRHRGAGLGGGHDEREQTLNQLLVEMDGFEATEGVILVSATNRPDVLDPALMRPGRFDRQVILPRPDVKGREGILEVHTKEVPLSDDVQLDILARGTPGFSGADLQNMVNEAALLAARESKDVVAMEDFERAKDKVLMGTERRSLVLSEEERRVTAYHEAGHALVGLKLPNCDPLHKVSIIPRGSALGITMSLPIDERHTYSREYLDDLIAMTLGGRAAEENVLGQITTGASNDIERASEVARRMVCKWGMSEAMGPLAYGKEEEQVFLGKEFGHQKDYSDSTADKIDSEVRRIIEEGLARAHSVIDDEGDALEKLAQALLERETLGAEEVKILLGFPTDAPDDDDDTGSSGEDGGPDGADDEDASPKAKEATVDSGDDEGAALATAPEAEAEVAPEEPVASAPKAQKVAGAKVVSRSVEDKSSLQDEVDPRQEHFDF
jgi:cell division protease FtsH